MLKVVISAEIILVEPRQPRNIGAVIRAAANFGIRRVWLIGTLTFTPEQSAEVRIASSGASELVEVRHALCLTEALSNAAVVIGATARPRHSAIPVITRLGELSDKLAGDVVSSGRVVSLVFGRESNGLTNEETQHCHYLLTLPVAPEFPSLNLAQAVAVVASQWYALMPGPEGNHIEAGSESMAPHEAVESLIARLDIGTETAGQWRRLLYRARASETDLALLFNLLKSQR